MFIIIGILISAAIYGIIGGIALKIAYKLVFTKYSMQLGDAFKLMFIVGLISYFAQPILGFALISAGVETPFLGLALAVGVNYTATTLVLARFEGLMLGQSLAVAALTAALFLAENILLASALESVVS